MKLVLPNRGGYVALAMKWVSSEGNRTNLKDGRKSGEIMSRGCQGLQLKMSPDRFA
jgi:hypothetical protein